MATEDNDHKKWIAEQEERAKKAAAEAVTTTAFFYYHPNERKARAREALRHIIKHGFRKDEDNDSVNVWLEGLWNIMAGHNDERQADTENAGD